MNLNNLTKLLKLLPTHDRIYPDCPHRSIVLLLFLQKQSLATAI
jgi:hypothetical protein